MESARVRRSLARICQVKVLTVGNGEQLVTYCFDEDKLMGYLLAKQAKIKAMLAKRHSNCCEDGDNNNSIVKVKKEEGN